MRELNDSEKNDLKQMFNSNWFKLMKQLRDEYKHDLLDRFTWVDLSNSLIIAELSAYQNFLKGINDFILTIETQSNKLIKKESE